MYSIAIIKSSINLYFKLKKIHKILTCKTSEKSMKYININKNAVKNMISIVLSYKKTNIKPKIFVLGTKINNNISNVIQN